VLSKILKCNIRNDSVFSKDNMLFGHFEWCHGVDIEEDLPKMAADPKTQERWAIMGPMQEALPTRKQDEWWSEMEEVFPPD